MTTKLQLTEPKMASLDGRVMVIPAGSIVTTVERAGRTLGFYGGGWQIELKGRRTTGRWHYPKRAGSYLLTE